MSRIKGHVGKWGLTWKSAPHGATGAAQVEIRDGDSIPRTVEVRWRRDPHGLWIELPDGVRGYDIQTQISEEGRATFNALQRNSDREWEGLCFVRPGEEAAAAGAGVARKGQKLRAQMPGKIIRILVESGAAVERNQPVAVMEAMKMENEIRVPNGGKVVKISVNVGQAVETGAELFVIDPA